jgi:arylsulfatase A-like enzyme/Flp pilus assembly protein TadD
MKFTATTTIRQILCVVWLVATACAASPPPNIVLITVDTTRADRMGFLGSRRGLTPNLDRLARESVVFTHAYSQVPLTTPSHATILTGTYPQFHQVEDFQIPLAEELPYAPAILKARGYQTAAFVGAMVLDPAIGLAAGFNRGFDTYDADFHQQAPGEDRYHSVERRGGTVVAHALAWLNRHPRGPFFLWVHLYDPHYPYNPPEPYKTKYKSAPYDGEIAYADSVVGKLLTQLRTRRLYQRSLIAMMADHGEALGDHGEEFHGFFLYDETIHVPLLFKLPAERFAGKRINHHVGLVDVLPTMLEIAQIPPPREEQGQSLLGMMRPASNPDGETAANPEAKVERPMYAETEYALRAYGWSSVRSWRTGKYLFIDVPRRELYEEEADPKSEHDLAGAHRAVADTLAAQLDTFRRKTSSTGDAPKSTTDPEVQEKLAALGYMASNVAGAAPKGAGADPKDKIEIGNMVAHANCLLEEWNLDDAISLLRELIAREPGMESLYLKLGTSQTMHGDFQDAVKTMRKAEELAPDSPVTHFNLAKTLMHAKDFEGAIPELNVVAAKLPDFWPAHLLLEIAYFRTDHWPEAIKECEKVLAVLPEQFGTNLLLGQSLSRSGDPEAALAKLKKAAALRPMAVEPHLYLAEAYAKMGLETDAARERAEAEHLSPQAQ